MAATAALSAAPKHRFDMADVVLYDPIAANRSATRGALTTIGFRRMQTPFDMPSLLQRIKGLPFDLLIMEVRPDPTPVFSMIQDIRQGRVGTNPFALIIATVWSMDDDIVRKIVQSGADDIIGRPFSIGFMGQRIKQLVDARKGFVVTADYVGPDRRRDAARGTTVTALAVPNSLKMKAVGGMDTLSIEAEIAEQVSKSREGINLEKARRNAFQMIIQSKLTSAALDGPTPTDAIIADLQKIENLAAEIVRRTEESPYSMSFQMCEPIIQAAQTARRGEELAHHLALIGQLATTLFATLSPGRSTDEIEFEVTQTVLMIQTRSQKS